MRAPAQARPRIRYFPWVVYKGFPLENNQTKHAKSLYDRRFGAIITSGPEIPPGL